MTKAKAGTTRRTKAPPAKQKRASTSKLIVATKRASLAANTARLGVLTRLIRRRLATVVESFYDVGEALREIADRKLYAVSDHASFAAWVEGSKLMSSAQAEKLLAIVRHVPREAALAAGQERAYALVLLAAATPEPDSAAELLAGGVVDGQPAAKASVRTIKAAAAAERQKRPQSPAQRAKAKADAAVEKGLRALLRAAGLSAKTLHVGAGEVRVVLARALVEKALSAR
ncbi:MAG: hypothetical protein EPO40_37465 [Myxococcaceae bacterium]|nr:MAG: hypothetical protein EPO40_37465 [Myxococcaceae bacterium]